MDKKYKGQTQAIQLTKKAKDKQTQHNGQERQRKNTGDTMNKKDKGQTQATKWTRKTKDKHRQYNVQKRQRTNTGNTIDKKDKGQTAAIQWTKIVFFVHCMDCVCPLSFLYIVWPVFVLFHFCPLYGLCLSFVFFVHCMAAVCPLSFLSIVWPVFVLCLFCTLYCRCLSFVFLVHYKVQKRQRTNTGHTIDKKDKGQTAAIQWTKKTKDKHRQYNGQK
jgi:hypothetical protein